MVEPAGPGRPGPVTCEGGLRDINHWHYYNCLDILSRRVSQRLDATA